MRIDAGALPPGAVVAVEVEGSEYVVWRGRSGTLGSAPRTCPHLDHDLAAGFVVDDELVCPGHGWAFDGHGRTFKRNEFGRVDAKGTVPALRMHEDTSGIRIDPEAP